MKGGWDGNMVNYHHTGGGCKSFYLTNFASQVCWAINLCSSLYMLAYHTLTEVWNSTVTFCFLLLSYTLLTKQQTCFMASTREVILTMYPVLVERWWQQTDQLTGIMHQFPLLWLSYFNFLLNELGVLHWAAESDRNYRPYIVSSVRNIVNKCYFLVQIWLVLEECFVIKLAKVFCLL